MKFFLGIEVGRSPLGISLWQRKYALDILAETGLLGSKPTDTPMEHGHKLALSEGEDADGAAYRQLVVIYLTITRPEISYSVMFSQFAQAPRKEHFEATFRIL
ncbi:UNVERIFIED_CONTAM: hypothetical protein Sradi_3954300 [Sesamum radiatum]|uniref:Uncharacterized protein n=1 Tax=Sesamum radiatum TaxID=300843 RepID=A0AAW2PJK6_SESRA